MYNRNITISVREALADTPVVFIRGARQTGKTTLVRSLISAEYPAQYVTLDNAVTLSAARANPAGFIAALNKPVIIDEIQRVPALILAIKEEVDRNRIAGNYLLTGSANVLTIPKVADSLAGRMEVITLFPLSQGEISGVNDNFIEAIFSDQKFASQLNQKGNELEDLMARIVTGGYPEPVQRVSFNRRSAWFDSYLTTIIERDIKDLSHLHDVTSITRLLQLLAARCATLRDQSEISRSLSIPNSSLGRYLSMLETIFLIRSIPAWSSNLGKRVVKAPKMYFTDTGLACHLLGFDVNRFLNDHQLAGGIMENFVVSELQKQISWNKMPLHAYHFRSLTGQEVDIVLEDNAGKICGIEVKMTASVTIKHFKGLKVLQELTDKRFVRGIVLYTGRDFVPFESNLLAVPLAALWS